MWENRVVLMVDWCGAAGACTRSTRSSNIQSRRWKQQNSSLRGSHKKKHRIHSLYAEFWTSRCVLQQSTRLYARMNFCKAIMVRAYCACSRCARLTEFNLRCRERSTGIKCSLTWNAAVRSAKYSNNLASTLLWLWNQSQLCLKKIL